MNKETKEAGVKAMLDLTESFLVVLEEFRELSVEIIPIMKSFGKEKLATVFRSSLDYFNERCGKENEHLEDMTLEEISFHNVYIQD